jgi:hypothetical protein
LTLIAKFFFSYPTPSQAEDGTGSEDGKYNMNLKTSA